MVIRVFSGVGIVGRAAAGRIGRADQVQGFAPIPITGALLEAEATLSKLEGMT